MLKHASLFSGIGGFDLAAEWAGWENIFHCEWNPFGQKVLAHHFPNSKSYNDITKTNFSIHEGTIDVLTGGFPCQPYSTAGKRLGKADERHLFPEMLRAIKEIKPRWVIGENVRGLVSWNGGLVFDEVCADLEGQGYEVQPFLIPAASVNAPHRRDRIWFVAYSKSNGSSTRFGQVQDQDEKISEWDDNAKFSNSSDGNVANSNNDGGSKPSRNLGQKIREKEIRRNKFTNGFTNNGEEGDASDTSSNGGRQNNGLRESRLFDQKCKTNKWNNFPTQPPICGGNDGISRELDGITFSKWRNESIKAYGNAIVPQVALQIFKAINEFELLTNK